MCGLEQLAVVAVALALQVIDADEAQGSGVDAVAQATGVDGPVGEDVAQVAVPWAERTSVLSMRWLKSRRWTTLPGSIGTVKLGQPEPLFASVNKYDSGSPDTTST